MYTRIVVEFIVEKCQHDADYVVDELISAGLDIRPAWDNIIYRYNLIDEDLNYKGV